MPRWPHRNVPLGLVANFLIQTAGSIAVARDAYVLQLPDSVGSATHVGIMEGISGVVNLVMATVVGVAADRYGRSPVLRLVGIVAAGIAASTCVAVLYFPSHGGAQAVFIAMCAVSALMGVVRGSFFTAFEALFGDSTPKQQRSKYYIQKQVSATLGLATGPVLAVVCFASTHNTWTTRELVVVILVGAALYVALGVACLFFTDVPAAPVGVGVGGGGGGGGGVGGGAMAGSTAALPGTSTSTGTGGLNGSVPARTASNGEASARLLSHDHHALAVAVAPEGRCDERMPCEEGTAHVSRVGPINAQSLPNGGPSGPSGGGDGGEDGGPLAVHRKRSRWVAPVISASNLLMGFGSGIAYKFIPLYCMQGLRLSPIVTHGVIAGMQIAATLLNMMMRRLARCVGPIGAVVLTMGVGNASLALVCFSSELRVPVPLVALAIGTRGACMNALGGLLGAVFNDHISTANRGKWSIVQTFGKTTWSGSAFAGGALVDAIGYERTLLVPLTFHVAAMLVLLPIVRSVPADVHGADG